MTDLSLVVELTILVLAIFLGFEVISKVPTMLHTPLMSGTNFIHGIIIVGAIIVLGYADDTFTKVVGLVAMVLATANVVGGWFVTDRMLEMFKRRPEPAEGAQGVISDPDVVGLLYLVAIVCFIVALRFLSSPRHARKGNWVGGVGMIVAIATTLLAGGDLELAADRRRRADRLCRRRDRRPHGEDDGDAADGGPVQRGRRRRGGPGGAGRVPRDVRCALLGRGALDRALRADRVDLVRRLAGRLRQAAGARQRPADRVPRPERRQRASCSAAAAARRRRSWPASRASGRSSR